ESADSPSIVVTDLPAISETWVWHENARLPSICTTQAPHRPVPQPNLVPVSFSPSRITHNTGVAGGASVDAALPFTVKVVLIFSSLQIDEDAGWAWQMTAKLKGLVRCPPPVCVKKVVRQVQLALRSGYTPNQCTW